MSRNDAHDDARRELRHALGRYTTGVAIVTAPGTDGKPVGMTINSFSSVSLAPALVAWCIDRGAASHEAFVNAGQFTITVLAANQAETAVRFATRGAAKFRDTETARDAAPVITGGCAWFKCNRYRVIPLGDHTMLIGKIREYARHPPNPLIFSDGSFQRLQTDHEHPGQRSARAA